MLYAAVVFIIMFMGGYKIFLDRTSTSRTGTASIGHPERARYITACTYNKTRQVPEFGSDGQLISTSRVTERVWGTNDGDTAFMIFGTTLVMLQTPAMGIAQAGMIRRKNSLSMLMQCLSGMAIGSLLWYMVGYSLTFGPSVAGGLIGNPSTFFFFTEMPLSTSECLVMAPNIPGPLYAAFQMMFALMVPVIVTGAWAEKMRMEGFFVFMVLWPLLVYYPVAHWVWGGGWMGDLGVKVLSAIQNKRAMLLRHMHTAVYTL
jgi:hypothetical protein